MKPSTKIILPIIIISALLILLNGCMGTVPDESPGFTPGTITGVIASPCCSTSDEPVSETCCIAPEFWCFYCQNTWDLQDGIKVVLTYGEDEIATTTTNDKGEFTFTDVAPGKNYVVTAYCPDFGDNRPLVKDVALELIEGGSFDTKITDLVSTSLGLVVDFLVLYTEWGPEDISLEEVLADRANFPNFPKFKKLVYEVRRVVENCEVNLLTDDDVQDALCRAAEEISKLEIGCGPGYTPPPPPPIVTYVLTTVADPTAGGTVVGAGTYNAGTVVLVTASPTTGWAFTGWSDDLTGTANPSNVTMNSNKNVIAHFEEIIEPNPALSVTKTADPTSAVIGDTITYSYAIVNTGNVTLTSVSAVDDKLGAVTLDKTTLAPGETATGTQLTHVVVEGDLPGPIVNTVNAEGYYGAISVSDSATASVILGAANSALSVTKTADPTSAVIGDTITYSYAIVNTGNVTLTSVSAVDDKLGAVTLDKTTLAPGETATGTQLTHVVVEGDLPGPIVNTVNAEGYYGAISVSDSATASVILGAANSALSVTKTADPTSAVIGDTITYSYAIVNTGNVTLTSVSAVDDKLGAVTLDKTTLAPGETATGTQLTHVVVEGDLPGPIVNTVNAEGYYGAISVSDSATASVILGAANSALSVTKTADPTSAVIGDTITYSYAIVNTGNVTLTSVSAVDDKLGAVTLDKTTLAPGETATGTQLTHVVVEGDLPGPIVNTVNAEGYYGAISVSDSATASVILGAANSALSVTKTADPTSAVIGDTITYSYAIVNTGNVTLTSVSAVDDKLGAVTLDKTTLAPGETATGTQLTHVVVEGDLPGPIVNTVNAEGYYGAISVSDSATASVILGAANSALSVTKTADPTSAVIGDTITYSYAIVNTGNVTLTSVSAVDDKLGAVTLDKTTLAPGETATGTQLTHVVVEGDLPGPIVNTVNAEGYYGAISVSDSATASVTLSRVALNYLLIHGYNSASGCVGGPKDLVHIEIPVVPNYIETGLWLFNQNHTPNVKHINFTARFDGVSTTIEYRYRYKVEYQVDGSISDWFETYWTWTDSGSSLVDDGVYGYGFVSDCMYAPSKTSTPKYYCYQFEIEIAVNGDYINTYLVHID